jgi:branched-chain amino acid transport system permease protein
VFQWQDVTGGSNGILGVWPTPPFEAPWSYYLLCVALAALVVVALRRALFAPFGYAMRGGRDSPLRAEAIGIDVKRVQWFAFALAGAAAGVAGGLFAFAKGSISPETIAVGRSIDAIVMVLLGGLEQLSGPIVGAGLFTLLQDTVMRQTEYWRALLGVIILVLVLVFPGGILGAVSRLITPRRAS